MNNYAISQNEVLEEANLGCPVTAFPAKQLGFARAGSYIAHTRKILRSSPDFTSKMFLCPAVSKGF
jgi:hypothetical protein